MASGNSSSTSFDAAKSDAAKQQKGFPISVITSLFSALVKKLKFEITKTSGHQRRKRKMPQIIDFISLAHYKYDEKKVHDEDPGLGVNQDISVSTELSLWFGPPNVNKKRKMVIVCIHDDDDIDPSIVPLVNLNNLQEWEIKKTLKRSDIDGSSKLLLGKELVWEYMLPHLMGVDISEAEGTEIAVWDVDT